ncbi:MAG: carbohydrate ABC transporter permease [Oscillospiraceae bacterium]
MATKKSNAGFANWCKTYNGQKYITSVLFLIIPVALLIVFTLIPALQIIPESFQDRGMLTTADDIKFVGFENYKTIFTDPAYLATFKTCAYYFVGSFLQQILALFIATVLCSKLRGKGFFKGVIFFPYLMNGVAVSIIFLNFFTCSDGFSPQGPLNEILGWFGVDPIVWLSDISKPWLANICLVGVSLWRYIGFDILMYISAIQSVSPDLYEACDLDGANSFQRFWYIIFPSIKPIVSLQLILAVKGAISVFEVPYIMTNGTNGTSTFVMRTMETMFSKDKVGLASAMAVVLLLIIIIVTLIQKAFFKDDTVESRKKSKKGAKA